VANNHLYTLLKVASIVSLAFLTTACQQQPTPDPSITAVRSGSGLDSNSADWINPEDVSRAESIGLPMRDPAMMGANLDANRIENLFEPVYFDFDQSFVRPQDRPVLQEAAEYLTSNPAQQMLIEGHCDWRGTTEYNMALGDRRAASVKAYLVQLGINPQRIETVSKGDLEAVTEASDQQMQEDRRADLVVIRAN